MKSTIGWWVVSEEGMVPCLRLGPLPLLLVTFVEGEEHNGIVNCIWWRYGALRKVRSSTPAFSYILWKLKSTIGYWVESEEGMATWVRLVTHTLFLVTSCGRWRAPLVGELHLRRYVALRKVSYSPLAFGYILWKVRSTIDWWVAS